MLVLKISPELFQLRIPQQIRPRFQPGGPLTELLAALLPILLYFFFQDVRNMRQRVSCGHIVHATPSSVILAS